MGLWTRVSGIFSAVGGLILPMFGAARGGRGFGIGPFLRGLLHIVLLALILLGLGWVHRRLDLDQYLQLPSPRFKNLWLPLLFLLVYVLAWLGRWLWDLLGPEQESVVFADIDQAWSEAVSALDQANVDLTSAPLFLVLGRPHGGDDALFQSLQPKMVVSRAPRAIDAPLHVYANSEGIYVTCPGASLLGRLAAILAQGDGFSDAPASGGTVEGETFATLSPTAQRNSEAIEQILARAREQGRDPSNLLDEERNAIGLLASQLESEAQQETGPARPSFLQDRAEVEHQTARLLYLCRMIARARRPYCPLNGVLLALPIAAGQTDDAATQVGIVSQRDLATVRKAMQVRTPVFALVCDLETVAGFRELINRLPPDQRDRRMGQRFPLVPDIEPTAFSTMIEAGVQQIGNRLIPNLVSTLWRIESTPGTTAVAEAVRGNVELYRLLGGVRDRQNRLVRVLTRVAVSETGPPTMLGGCYFAGTGADPARGQAFIPGVFRRLIESQDFVTWTPEALSEERSYQVWARIGWAALGLIAAACVGLAAYVFLPKSP